MTDRVPAGAAETNQALASRILAAIRARRTYLTIYQHYRKATHKADFAALLDSFVEDTQEALTLLGHQLRVLGHSPVSAGSNEVLLGQGMGRKGTLSKLNFLLVGTAHTVEWYTSQQTAEDPTEVVALWQQLISMEMQHQQMIKDLLAAVELAGEPDTAPDQANQQVAASTRRPSPAQSSKHLRKVRLRRSPGSAGRRKRDRT